MLGVKRWLQALVVGDQPLQVLPLLAAGVSLLRWATLYVMRCQVLMPDMHPILEAKLMLRRNWHSQVPRTTSCITPLERHVRRQLADQ